MPAPLPQVFELPAALLREGYALRPEAEDDLPFLERLYASTREAEMAQLSDWTAEQKQAFLAGQFAAQRYHYRHYFPESRFDVLTRHGEPAGRLYLETRVTRLHIIDIALLPAWQGKGLGTAVLKALIEAARDCGRGVGIFVERFNPALRLYRRLGFAEIGGDDVYLEMEWTTGAEQPASAEIS